MKSKIDIILPTYNGASYIKELLNSILTQSDQNFTIYIRDDGSQDDTKKIIQRYKELYPTKIHIIMDELGNLGVINNTFEILKYSCGEYIMFCDQDDVWFPSKISEMLRYIRCKEAGRKQIPVLIHSDAVVTDRKLKVIDPSFMHYSKLNWKRNSLCNLIQRNIVQGASIIINKQLLVCSKDLIGRKSKKCDKTVFHDLWFALLAAAFGEIYYYPKALMYYRQHGNNLIGAKADNTSLRDLLFDDNGSSMTYLNKNYLLTNSKVCDELLTIYKGKLSHKNIEILKHLKYTPANFVKFASLGLYRYYSIKEIALRLMFGVRHI